jgi:hypothetical protein
LTAIVLRDSQLPSVTIAQASRPALAPDGTTAQTGQIRRVDSRPHNGTIGALRGYMLVTNVARAESAIFTLSYSSATGWS